MCSNAYVHFADLGAEGALGWAVLLHEAAADLLPAEDLRLQGCVTACGKAGHRCEE